MPVLVWLPYTHLLPQLPPFLDAEGLDWVAVEMTTEASYPDYFEQRWTEGKPFVNLEHDVLPWPSAIQALIDCPRPLCAFAYSDDSEYRGTNLYFGLVRFSAEVIAATSGIWSAEGWEPWRPRDWTGCDAHWSQRSGIPVHQHRPAVRHLRDYGP